MRDTLELVEYNRFKTILERFILTKYGKRLLRLLKPCYSINEAKTSLSILEQFTEFFERETLPPVEDIYIDEIVKEAQNGTLGPEQLREVGAFLNMLVNIERGFSNSEFKHIYDNFINFRMADNLRDKISLSIDEYGYIKDSASKRLKELREEIKHLREEINRALKGVFQTGARTVLIDTNVFFRKSRYTLLVKPNFREYLNGRIVDTSKTGGYFVEPFFVATKNDRLEEILFMEEAEIRKILSEITELVRKNERKLTENGKIVGFIDLQMAKYHYSKRFGTCDVTFGKETSIYAENAKHPVLVDIKGKHVVGTTIDLKNGEHIIVTGPNTGGKTVFIKTIGLLVACVYSGIPPTASTFHIGPINSLEAVIGDEQNIEESLSGFSAKVERINRMTKNMTDKSLVLIDEVGSGTSPDEGEAIAYAVAHFLRRQGCLFVMSTHYRKLAYILKSEGFRLASFEFDEETLRPTYKITYDRVGKSYGINILENLGAPAEMVKTASNFLAKKKNLLDHLADKMQEELKALDSKLKKAKEKEEEYTRLLESEKRAYENLQKELKKEHNKKKTEFDNLLREARTMIRDLMRKKNVSVAHRGIERLKTTARNIFQEPPKYKPLPVIKEGDTVEFRGEKCRVVKLKGNQACIEFDSGLINVPLEVLKKTSETARKSAQLYFKSKINNEFEVNIIGKRREEALMELINFLDFASTEGVKSVRVVHGKGTGVLREMVRGELKKHPRVRSFRMAPPNQGGDGVTIVELE